MEDTFDKATVEEDPRLELVELENRAAFFTAGIYGEGGTGKTRLGVGLAVYIAERHRERAVAPAPIAVFDTEASVELAARPYKARLAKLGVRVLGPRAGSRQFAALVDFTARARAAGACVLLVDQATHVRRDVERAYRAERGRERLDPSDREAINNKFREWTDEIANLPMHVIVVGRAADAYDDEVGADGERRHVRTGLRIDAGRDLGYEPLVIVEMERVRKKASVVRGRAARVVSCRATVVKDKTGRLHGRVLEQPRGASFAPILDELDGVHAPIETAPSPGLFSADEEARAQDRERRKLLQELSGALAKAGIDGQDREGRQRRAQELDDAFGTTSMEAIGDLELEELREGVERLVLRLESGGGA